MEIDDSVFFEEKREARAFHCAVWRKFGAKKLISRPEGTGIRVWRIG